MAFASKTRLPIAQLGPTIDQQDACVHGVISVIWPYSVSKQSWSFLLVEPDFRLRRSRGQIRVSLHGACARRTARLGLASGDEIYLDLASVQWLEDAAQDQTPGKSVGWEISYSQRIVVEKLVPEQPSIVFDTEHMSPSPEPDRSIFSLTPPDTPNRPIQTPPPKPVSRLRASENIWTSPAFLKETPFPSVPTSGHAVDPFWEVEDGWEEGPPTKRAKFGRASGQWRFAERTPSPEAPAEKQVEEVIQTSEVEATEKKLEDISRPDVRLTPQSDAQELQDEMQRDEPRVNGSKPRTPAEDAVDEVMMDESFEEPIKGALEALAKTEALAQVPGATIEDTSMVDAGEIAEAEFVKEGDKQVSAVLNGQNEEAASQADSSQRERSPSVMTEVLSNLPSPSHTVSATFSVPANDNIQSNLNTDALEPNLLPYPEPGPSPTPIDSQSLGLEQTAFSRQRSPGLHIEIREATPLPDDMTDDHSQAPGTPRIQPLPSPGLSIVSPLETRPHPQMPSPVVSEEQETALRSGSPEPSTPPAQVEYATPIFPKDVQGARETSPISMRSSSSFATQEEDEVLPDLPSEVEESPSPEPSSDREVTDTLQTGPTIHDHEITDFQTKKVPTEDSSSNFEGDQVMKDTKETGEEVKAKPQMKRAEMSMIERALEEAPLAKHQDSPIPIFEGENPPVRESSVNKSPKASQTKKSVVGPSDGSSSPILYDDSRLSDELEEEFETQGPPQPDEPESDAFFEELMADFKRDHGMSDIIEMPQSYVDADKMAEEPAPDLKDSNLMSSEGNVIGDEEQNPSDGPESIEVILSRGQEQALIKPEPDLPRPASPSRIKPEVQDTYDLEAEMLTSDLQEQEPLRPTVEIIDLIGSNDIEASSSVQDASGDQELQALVEREETEPVEDLASPTSAQQLYSSQPKVSMRDSFSEDAMLSSEVEKPEGEASQPQFTMPSDLPSSFSQISGPLNRAQSKLAAPKPMETDEEDTKPLDENIKTKDFGVSYPRTPELTQPVEGESSQVVLRSDEKEEPTLPTPRLTQKSTNDLEEHMEPQKSDSTPMQSMDTQRDEEGEVTPKAIEPQGEQLPNTFSQEQAAPNTLAKSSFFSQQPPSSPPMLPEVSAEKDVLFNPLELESTGGFRTSISYYVSLAYLHEYFNKKIDILTICVSATKPEKSKKGLRDWTQTLLLTDPSSSTTAKSIIVAQLFRPKKDVLPLPDSGDVVLLRDIKVQTQKQKMMLISTNSSAWAVWRQGILEDSDKVEVRGPPIEIGAEERGFVRGLAAWWASLDEGFKKRIMGPDKIVKAEEIKDLNGEVKAEVDTESRRLVSNPFNVSIDEDDMKRKRRSMVEVQVQAGIGRRAKQQLAAERQKELTSLITRSKQKESTRPTISSPASQSHGETTPQATRSKRKEKPTPIRSSPAAEAYKETTPAVTRSQTRASSTPTGSSPTSQPHNGFTLPNTRLRQKGSQVPAKDSLRTITADSRSPKSPMKTTHILRNGVKYTDDASARPRSRGGKNTTHELRDGKKWQDDVG